MNKNKYDTGFAGKLKLKFRTAPELKENKSEPQMLNKTAPNFWAVLALDIMNLNSNIMVTMSEKAVKVANSSFC